MREGVVSSWWLIAIEVSFVRVRQVGRGRCEFDSAVTVRVHCNSCERLVNSFAWMDMM